MAGRNGSSEEGQLDKLRDRINKAVEKADLAFWAEIAKAFPEAKSGDFPPDATFAWNRARDEAVYWWLIWNHPKSELIEQMHK
jgi:hypothetical protein